MSQQTRSDPVVAAAAAPVPVDGTESVDVSTRHDVHKLKPHAVGLVGVLFMALAGSAPLTAMLGNVPIAVGSGNGDAAPGGFIFAAVVLALFAVGYVAMARRFTTAGGFYGFISHGLGRPLGMAAGWSGMAAYAVFEASLMGIFAFYTRNTFAQYFGVSWPWPLFAFGGIVIIGILTYFDVRLSARVLGVATACEIILLVLMDIFVFAKGGGPSGITAAPLNPLKAFTGLDLANAAPGVGIFFAFWSWVGFEAAANYAEESKNPRRIVPRAVYIAVLGLGVFYTWTAWSVILGHGLLAAPKAAATNPVTFFYTVAAHFVSPVAKDVMEWLIVTSSFACGMAFHNAATRYFYAMGRERVFNRHLGRTHHRWQSPHVGSLFQSGIATVLVGLFLLLWYTNAASEKFANFQNAPYDELYAWLAILGTFWILLLMIGSSLGTLSYFLRHRGHHEEHMAKWLAATLVGAGGMIYAVYLLWANIQTLGGNIFFVTAIPYIGVGWVVLGIVIALVLRKRSPEKYEVIGRMVNEGI
jgi:amino acid transporter